MYLAETREQAIRDVEAGWIRSSTEYFQDTLGRPFPGTPMAEAIRNDSMLVGSPDDAIAMIERLLESSGGFGGLLFVVNEWTDRRRTLESYELFARYVAPHFQGALAGGRSQQFVASTGGASSPPSLTAIANAFLPPAKRCRRKCSRDRAIGRSKQGHTVNAARLAAAGEAAARCDPRFVVPRGDSTR